MQHFPSTGQFAFMRQLHLLSVGLVLGLVFCVPVYVLFRSLWLCPCIIACIFFVQLYPIFIVFLFIILCKGFLLGKFLSIMFRNSLPMFVVTLELKGGVYHIASLFLVFLPVVLVFFSLYLSLVLYPLLFSACWYSALHVLKASLFADISFSLLFIALGRSLL